MQVTYTIDGIAATAQQMAALTSGDGVTNETSPRIGVTLTLDGNEASALQNIVAMANTELAEEVDNALCDAIDLATRVVDGESE